LSLFLRGAVGDEWRETCVASGVRTACRKKQGEVELHRFHTQRGDAPINYTELKQLLNIIRANQEHFTPDFSPSAEWATANFDTIERSRNVITHSGTLDLEDIERVGLNLRDWVRQVGA
jgi:hypothetical protein